MHASATWEPGLACGYLIWRRSKEVPRIGKAVVRAKISLGARHIIAYALRCTSYEGLDMSTDQFPSKSPKDVVFSTLGKDFGI